MTVIEATRVKLCRAPLPEIEDLDEDRQSRDVDNEECTKEDIDVMD